MTGLLTVPVIGKDIFKCGHPRTEENTYHVTYKGREIEQCRTCNLSRSAAQYRRSKTNEPAPSKRLNHFCLRCEMNECKNGRLHLGGCYRDVSKDADSLVCRCGVSWSRNWKREIGVRDSRTILHRRGLEP